MDFCAFFSQVLGILTATDKDDQPASFTFSLASESANFSIRDYRSKSSRDLPLFSSLWLKEVLRGALVVAMQHLKPYLRHGVG